ncbi:MULTISPECIES: hypothetical protein [Exiguobacterium]|uniref:hypothetical protein n=1 Tax=Exiguobacterium TaxID=33986 RepID=UPI00093A3EB7|nr:MULTISPECIES: hypothetical protein [Exiguobacterium]
MIIKFDFGDNYIQYISCSSKVGRKIHKTQNEFFDWIFDDEKNKKYWAYENGEKDCPNYDAYAIVDWLNHVKFKKGIAKAKVVENLKLKPKKTFYY